MRMSRSTRRRGAVALAVSALTLGALAVAVPSATAAAYTPGSAGLGDPYFPLEGNGGYDVGHYDLNLAYVPATHALSGTVTVTATATQNLSRFDLDLNGMTVDAVTVNNTAATFTRSGQELKITPRAGIVSGAAFTTAVTYHGVPKTITGSPIVFGADYGWQYTPDGAFVGDEPNAASTWFPCNDHPLDKATFGYTVSVPVGTSVIANGDLLGHTNSAGQSRWTWDETSPMATYLATIDIGKWTIRQGQTAGGIPELVANDPALAGDVRKHDPFGLSGDITDYWARTFGPYPFTSTGAIIDNVPDVGFSLETQTRPLYGFVPDPGTASHELSHQWFGDSVSVASWDNIWLNEGFATFSGQLWNEHTGGESTYQWLRDVYRQVPAGDAFWNQSIAAPGRNAMFSSAVYYRGGMTLAALRHKIGDTKFFTLLKTWTAQHRYGNATTSQFVALAEQVSGQKLATFFDVWLWQKSKPATVNG